MIGLQAVYLRRSLRCMVNNVLRWAALKKAHMGAAKCGSVATRRVARHTFARHTWRPAAGQLARRSHAPGGAQQDRCHPSLYVGRPAHDCSACRLGGRSVHVDVVHGHVFPQPPCRPRTPQTSTQCTASQQLTRDWDVTAENCTYYCTLARMYVPNKQRTGAKVIMRQPMRRGRAALRARGTPSGPALVTRARQTAAPQSP